MNRLRITAATVTLTCAATLGTVALANAATLTIRDATITGPAIPAAPRVPSAVVTVTR